MLRPQIVMQPELILSPSDFVAITNQTLEYALGIVCIEGEISNFRISKNKWLYFDVIDEESKVSFFGTIYHLPGPLENGMVVKVAGRPHLHNKFGFSISVQTITPSGEGSIKKLLDALKLKLEREGLFEMERKRQIKYPPKRIGLITSLQSAAYADFIKILNARWPFLTAEVYNVLVQGDGAPSEIVQAIEYFNTITYDIDALVIIRGGGSDDDLSAFNDERVVRKIAGSRIPTLVAIGHEINLSLGELVADIRASTPSNAAELMVPDLPFERKYLQQSKALLVEYLNKPIKAEENQLEHAKLSLKRNLQMIFDTEKQKIENFKELLIAYNPNNVLKRGYSLLRKEGRIIKIASIKVNDIITITTQHIDLEAQIVSVNKNGKN